MGGGLLLLTGLCFGGTLPHFTGQSLLLLGYMVLLSAVAMAAVALVSAPLFLVFVFLRKYIMTGVSRSGIKG